MDNIIFVGDRDFTAVFGAFGFPTAPAASAEEFEKFLASVETPGVLICAAGDLRISFGRIASLCPADVVFLPRKFDRAAAVEEYRAVSERASGVDLTGKL